MTVIITWYDYYNIVSSFPSIQEFRPPLLIFVQSVDRAKQLFHELIYDGMNVDVIHSDRTRTQRDNIIKSFRAGKVNMNLPRKGAREKTLFFFMGS